MARFFAALFKPKVPRVVQNAILGELRLQDEEWCFVVDIDGKAVEATIPDVNGSPCAESQRVAEGFRSASDGDLLWKTAVKFTVDQLAPLGIRFDMKQSKFELDGVSFHPPGTYEGGEVVFWFRIDDDKNGTYFVPLHNGVPQLWHRDS